MTGKSATSTATTIPATDEQARANALRGLALARQLNTNKGKSQLPSAVEASPPVTPTERIRRRASSRSSFGQTKRELMTPEAVVVPKPTTQQKANKAATQSDLDQELQDAKDGKSSASRPGKLSMVKQQATPTPMRQANHDKTAAAVGEGLGRSATAALEEQAESPDTPETCKKAPRRKAKKNKQAKQVKQTKQDKQEQGAADEPGTIPATIPLKRHRSKSKPDSAQVQKDHTSKSNNGHDTQGTGKAGKPKKTPATNEQHKGGAAANGKNDQPSSSEQAANPKSADPPAEKSTPDVKEDEPTAKKPKREKTAAEKQAHARYMRFSRSLTSLYLSLMQSCATYTPIALPIAHK